MSTTIDERIVQMQFDNKQFESGVQTSLKSLDRLKSGLNLEESAKSLQNLEKAGRSFSLANVASSVESISSRFTNLGIVGITTLQRITNSAITAGTQLVKSLTLDPVMTGFNEYETKMNAITTILTNTQDKGTTLDDVNETLQELNEYADQTIYNFAEMTRNIGTFTAAGVDLETSAKAIKGIANLAAGSGSSAQQASTAMYQLSQALAAGRVTLEDWNSVVNAGMGGQLFQNALKETAKQMGIVVDESVSFRESISAQNGQTWLTSDVLIKTLEKFAEDDTLVKAATQVKTFTQLLDTMKESVQSGWAVSWEYIIGDREQAISVLTAISDGFNDLIAPSTEARNATLKFWNENGGRDAIIEGLAAAFKTLTSVLRPIGDAFNEVFPPMTGERLVEISKKFRDLLTSFTISEKTTENLKRTFQGLFSVVKIGISAVSSVASVIGKMVGYVLPAGDGLLGLTASFGDFVSGISKAIDEGGLFEKIVEKIGNVIEPVASVITKVFGAIGRGFSDFSEGGDSGFLAFISSLIESASPLETLGNLVDKVFGGLSNAVQKALPLFSQFGSVVAGGLGKLTEVVSSSDLNTIANVFNIGALASITVSITKFTNSMSNAVNSFSGIFDGVKGIFEGVNDVLDEVSGTLKAYQTSIKSGALIKIAGAIAILAASLFLLSMIDSEKLAGSLTAITVLFGELYGFMALMDKASSNSGFGGIAKMSASMLVLSTSVLILSSALKKISDLDWDELLRGLVGIGALSAILTASAKSLSSSSGRLVKGSAGLLIFAASIRVLVGAVEDLGNLDAEQLAKGLIGVGVLCAELALFLKVTNFDSMGVRSGTGMLLLAASLNVLASAVSKFSELGASNLVKGLTSIGVILTQIGVFSKLTGGTKGLMSTAIGMNLLGASMLIFADAIAQMGSMSLEQIGKGLLAMGGALLEVVLAMSFMPKNMLGNAIALIGISSALIILSNALTSLSSMSWEGVATSLVSLGGALAIIVIAVNAMTGALAGAAALLAVSAAISVFTPALLALSKLSLSEIGIALLALAGSFAVLGGAALILSPVTPALLALAGAVALFGVAALAVGTGVAAFAAGLSALAVSGVAGASALVTIVASLSSLIPLLIAQVGRGIIALANVIAAGAPSIANAVIAIVSAILKMVDEIVPDLVEVVIKLIDSLLQTLADHVPSIIQAGFDILLGLLKGIRDNIGEVVTVAIDIILEFLNAISAQIPTVVDGAFDFIISFIDALGDAIRENTPRLVDAMIGLAGDMVQGLLDGFFGGIKSVVNGVASLGEAAVDGLKDVLGIASPSKVFKELGGYTSEGFAKGITDNAKVANIAADNLGLGIVKALKDTLEINSPSRVTRDEVGRYVVQGIAEGITADMSAEEAAAQKAKNIVNAFQTEFDKFDLDAETSDLEYQLWEKLNGATASESEKAAANMNLLTNKLALQAEKVKLYQAQYQTTIENVGAQAEETQDAYNKLLQAQIDLLDLSDQLNEARSAESAANREALKRYNEYLFEYQDILLQQGFTLDEIRKAAAEQSGYNPESMTTDMSYDVESAVAGAMSTVQTAYETNAQETFGALTSNFSSWGTTYANALGTALQNGSSQVTSNVQTMVQKCVTAIRSQQPSWIEGGSYLVDGFILGIQQNVSRAAQEAAAMAMAAYQAAMSALKIRSPSRRFAELGMYADLGLAKGFKDYSYLAESESEKTAEKTVTGFSAVISHLTDVLNSDMELNPTIRPVVDMDDIRKSGTEIGAIFDRYSSLNVASSLSRARFTSSTAGKGIDGGVVSDPKTGGNTYNYLTQNNYSPKALSRTEIYRQTKNLYSRLKGR